MFVASAYNEDRTKVVPYNIISLSDATFKFCCYTYSGFFFVMQSSLIMFSALSFLTELTQAVLMPAFWRSAPFQPCYFSVSAVSF